MESVLCYEQSKQAGLIRQDKLVSIVVRGCVAFEKGQMSNAILSGSSSQSFKGFLSQLRELSVAADGLSLRSASHRSLVQNLLRTAREMPDRDIERKVCRVCIFLIATVLYNSSSSSSSGGGGKLEPTVASSLFDFLNLEVIKGSGSRQAFAIKALSQIALPCGRLEESINTISQLILRSRYPTHRKVVLLGQKKADRDYEIALQLWSAVMVAFRSLNFAPTASFDEVLFTASQSENAVLARHSLSLIASAALEREDLPETTQRQRSISSTPTSSVSLSPGTSSSNLDQSKTALATKLLAKIRIGGVQFHDSLACTYVFKAVSTFASSNSVPIELVAELYDELFLKLRDKVSSGTMSGAKATSDLLQSFIGHSRVDELKTELAKPKHYLDLLSHLTQAVDRYVLALDLGSVAAPVLLRSAATIGRYLLSRNGGTEMDEAQHLLRSVLTKLDSYGPLRLAFYPHALRDALRALLWLLPNSPVPLWEDFVKRVLASNIQLGEDLSLGIFDSFFDRIVLCMSHEARTNELGGSYTFYVKILLYYGDALVSRFGSRGACDRLDRTWDWLSGLIFSDGKDRLQQFSLPWRCGIKRVFLDSLMLFLDQPKGNGAQSLRGKVFFQLAEHVFACQDMQDPEAGIDQNALEIVNALLFGALTETGSTKLLCLQGLTLIVIRLHIIVRLSRSSKPEHILSELVVRLTELVVDAKGARGVIFRPECGCCVSVAGGSSELRCLWALGALPLPPCSVCKEAAADSQLSSSLCGASLSPSLIVGGNLSRVFEISTWPGIGHGNSLGVGTAAINTMRQLETLKACINGILVDEQEEAMWRSVCRFTDFRFDAWRSSLTSHDVAGSLSYVSLRRGSNSSISDEVTVTVLPLQTVATVTPTKAPDHSLLQLDDLPPPPPASPAPAIPPKPQRPATTTTMNAGQDIFSFEQSMQLPPPPPTPTPTPTPPPPSAPAPPISPQPSFDAFDSQSASSTPDRKETLPWQTSLYMPHQSTPDAFANIPLPPPQQPQALVRSSSSSSSSSSFDHFASLASPASTAQSAPEQQAFLRPSPVLSPSADSLAATSAPTLGRRPSLIPSPSAATVTGTGVGKSPLIAPPPSASFRSNRRK